MRYRSMLAVGLAAVILLPALPGATRLAAAAEGPAQVTKGPNGIDTIRQGDRVAQSDSTGKGAVLCMWSILDSVRVAGRECFKGQDQAFQTELDGSVKQIDAFIIKNSSQPVTQAGLEARHAQTLQQVHAVPNLCTGDVAKMYQALRARGAAQLRASTADLLSIPREPVMNPCL